MSKTIYIAGKVTGLPETEVWVKFWDKGTQLMSEGHKVFNPVMQVEITNHIADAQGTWDGKPKRIETWFDAMKFCIWQMMECDEVHMLPCWKDSKGARIEHDLAKSLGMVVVYC